MSSPASSLFVVSAPSGAGKSTVVSGAMARVPGIRFSVSHTTRPPRAGEEDGVHYHFVSPEGFEDLVRGDGLLEHAEVHGHRYGTSWSEYERARADGVDLLLDVDVQGAAQVRTRMPGMLSVFILPPSFEALERRLRGRGQDEEATIRRRLDAARREIGRFREYDYAIVNDDVARCVDTLACVIRSARARVACIETAAQEILRTFPTD